MRARIIAAAVAAAAVPLLVPGLAAAAAPAIQVVSHVKRHPHVTWALAPGTEARVIEISTSPDVASSGDFFSENVVEFDTLLPAQTSWLDEDQLKPGTYYVHVASEDPSCSYISCPPREWSDVRQLVIANERPRITLLSMKLRGSGSGWAYTVRVVVRLRVCDDTGIDYVLASERKWIGRRTFARGSQQEYVYRRFSGCRIVSAWWYLADKFFGVGWYGATVWVKDADGATSNRVSRRWFTGD